ncbi:MAG: hypothetical protein AAF740_05865, partial [Bacteroidota bacterium]
MVTLSASDRKLELIMWITQLSQERTTEVHQLLSPLFQTDAQSDVEIWEEVRETIYAERQRSAQNMQQKMKDLT